MELKNLIAMPDPDVEFDKMEFIIGDKVGDYYKIYNEVLSLQHDFFIHKDINMDRKFFVSERNISIFNKIDKLIDSSFYIGGDQEDNIPHGDYIQLIKKFPNTLELNKYAAARVSSIISSSIKLKKDNEQDYQNYLNKKESIHGDNLMEFFSEIELHKFQTMLKKLTNMLNNEMNYNETTWQKEILEILLLLYPKYICVFTEAPVQDFYKSKIREIDYLLIDSSGNIDIIEIKKPFDKSIVTTGTYRDNHIPMRELSGTVMQIEKYIFHLNKSGSNGEKTLNEKYKDKLPNGMKIKITNPSAIIISGRSNNLTDHQLQDFEIIRRKYKNLIDIITYDDLIERLKFIISSFQSNNKI
ncbi:Shedu immune nuclease family protein [Pectobacterium araliae]|uniref:Shedu immune nuclease family protein n=1 Tax=Pectobacterium araliae TaxID=3073862 RepID=UPI0021C3DCB9